MPTYNQGSSILNNTFLGIGGTESLTPGTGVTSATVYLGGVLTTWNISGGTGISLTIDQTLAGANQYNIDVLGGAVSFGTIAAAIGTSTVTIDQGGSFSVAANLITANLFGSTTIGFSTGGGTSIVGTAGSFLNLALASTSPYTGFTSTSDHIDDTSLRYTTNLTYSITGSPTGNQTITLNNGTNTFSFVVNNANFVAGNNYTLASGPLVIAKETSGSGTVITPCFVTGTLIRTPDGNVAVESLKAGDLVVTIDGRAVPVRWMGVKVVASRFADPVRLMPVRIRAGALGENLPERDLLISSDHAMLLDGALVQGSALVNGSSIVREMAMPEFFTYYHVETEDHSIILAEGAATETFIDNVDRMAFDNWAEHEALFGADAVIPELPYARAKSGRQVPASVRTLLAQRQAVLSGAETLAA